jgi:hypothetical protein
MWCSTLTRSNLRKCSWLLLQSNYWSRWIGISFIYQWQCQQTAFSLVRCIILCDVNSLKISNMKFVTTKHNIFLCVLCIHIEMVTQCEGSLVHLTLRN